MINILVAIPALNEERSIASVLDKLSHVQVQGARITSVVVDDGSTDGTAGIAVSRGVQLISHGRNRGVGAAFRSAVRQAILLDSDILVYMDGDGQFDPAHTIDLVKPVMEDRADFVTATRFLNGAPQNMPWIKVWGNRRVSRLVSMLIKHDITDASCGFRAYSRKAFLNLNSIGDFTYTHESILTLAFKGFGIEEVDIPVRGVREFGESRVASNLTSYAFQAMLIILRCYRDYKPMQTFGLPGACLMALGIFQLALFFGWTFFLGRWYPKILAFSAAFTMMSGLVLIVIALIADMFTRLRVQMDNLIQFTDRKTKQTQEIEHSEKFDPQ